MHHCLLPAQRCAVVAAAPPAVPLQRRYRPRSARAAFVAPCSGPVPLHRCAQPLRSHRPRHEHSCSRPRRCAAPPHHSPALPSTALPRKWRLRIGLASALARAPYGCLHRPCALQGAIDHGCDSAAYGRTGDTREHPECACTACRAHIPTFTASPTQTAGAPAPPQPSPTVEAVGDTGATPHGATAAHAAGSSCALLSRTHSRA